MTTGAKALTAFNTFSGAFGLATGLVGLFSPDPLQGEIDAIGEDLAEIKDQLGRIGDQIVTLRSEVAAGFDQEFTRDLNGALANVQSVAFELERYRAGEDVDPSDLISDANREVNYLMSQVQPGGLSTEISTQNATHIIEAINYAVSLRMTVAQELEDGAIGSSAVRAILESAANAVDATATGLGAYLADSTNYIRLTYNPTRTETITEWSGYELASYARAVPHQGGFGTGSNDSWIDAFSAQGSRMFTASEYAEIVYDNTTFWNGDRSNLFLRELSEVRADTETLWRPSAFNTETGKSVTTEVTFRYNDDTYAFHVQQVNLMRVLNGLTAQAQYRNELDLEQLTTTSASLRDLAEGDTILGQPGQSADSLNGTDGFDLITALGGDDVVRAGEKDDVVRGGEGNDSLYGEGGADVLDGGSGNDRAEGGEDNDVLYGGAGRDSLNGGTGEDQLLGGDGADYLNGGAGADIMAGGLGNDFYIVGSAGDEIVDEVAFSQGGGIDTVRTYVNDFVQPDNIELVRITGITGTQNFNATGNDAPGTLVGNAGNNVLTGRGGNDQINGNGGNDRLIGNTGRDTLVGGGGADTFVYNSISESRAGAVTRDVINGFDRGADVIDLSAMDANLGLAGEGAFEFIGNAGFDGDGAASAGQLRLQQLGGANAVIVEGDLRGDGVADFQIFVNLTTVLNAGDFIL